MILFLVKLLLFVGFFTGGLKLTHKYIHHSKLEAHNEVAGFIYAVVGVIFAVLLAFVVMNVWEQHNSAEKYIQNEASHVIDIYRNAEAYPEKQKKAIQSASLNYMSDVVDFEFKAMQDAKISPEAMASYKQLWKVHLSYVPTTSYENMWYEESIRELNELADSRRYRIDSISDSVEPLMWLVLIVGATMTILFCYLFGTQNRKAHLLMVFFLATTIGINLLLIDAYNHPYEGLIRISPDSFELALRQLTNPA